MVSKDRGKGGLMRIIVLKPRTKAFPVLSIGLLCRLKLVIANNALCRTNIDKPEAKSQSKAQAPKRERGIWHLG